MQPPQGVIHTLLAEPTDAGTSSSGEGTLWLCVNTSRPNPRQPERLGLKVKRFMGTSENAVRIQVFVALIAFLLLRMAHAGQTRVSSMVRFARLMRANLMLAGSVDAVPREFVTPRQRRRKPAGDPPRPPPPPSPMRLFGNVFGGAGCLDF